MREKSLFKIIDIVLIITIFMASFAGFSNISIANTDNHTDIDVSIESNKEESNLFTNYNGYDVYKVNSTMALDIWLNTTNANLTYFQVNPYNTRGDFVKQSKIEVNPELSNLSEFINIENGTFTFNSENSTEPVYLTSNKKIKLATFYFQINDLGTIFKNEYKTQTINAHVTAKRNEDNLKTQITAYNLAVSEAPTRIQSRLFGKIFNILGVGWTEKVQATVYGTYIENDEEIEDYAFTCQKVNVTSSDESVVKVFSDGTVRAMANGHATLRVSSALDPNVYDEMGVEVSRESKTTVEDIEIANPISKMHIYDTHELQVNITPEDAKYSELKYESSNSSVASIDDKGKITALIPGNTTITVYSGNISKEMNLEVVNEVTSLKINNPIKTASMGTNCVFYYTVTPSDKAKYVKFKVTSNDLNSSQLTVRTTETSGIISAKDVGRVKVIAYVGDVEDSFYMDFVPGGAAFVPTTNVEISNKKEYLAVNTKYQLEATAIPINATNKEIHYSSSDETVATVDENGLITTLKEGTTKITATINLTNGTRTDYFDLTVQSTEIPLESIELQEHEISLNVLEDYRQAYNGTADKKKVYIDYNPSNTTMDREITYSTSDVDIANVKESGIDGNGHYILIQPGLHIGKATITVKSIENDSLVDTLDVNVRGINFEDSIIQIDAGKSYQTSNYITSFEDPTEEVTNVEYDLTQYPDRNYNTTGEVVTLDESGLIIGKDNGTASLLLTATTNKGNTYKTKLSITCKVRVEKITVTPKVVEAVVGDEGIGIHMQIEPMNAWERYTTRVIADESIISQDGLLLKALKAGETTITIVSNDTGVYDTVLVKVVNQEHEDKSIVEAVPSTCVTHGHDKYEICNVCGEILSGSNAELPLDESNHINIDTYEAEPSTCIQHGRNGYSVCRDCGKIVNGSDEELPYSEHTGGVATCTKKAICEICGKEYGELNSENHTNTTKVDAVKSTCTTYGHEEYVVCNDCGKVISGSNTELDLLAHTGGEATCINKAICEVCGQEYGELDSTKHKNTEIRNLKEPTVQKEGYTGDLYCKDCETLLEQGTSIDKLVKPVYKVIEGAEQTYTKDVDENARFRTNGEYELFDKVYVDDNLVDSSNYTAVSGSTVITFNKDYMNSLTVGNHSLKVTYIDEGEATTTFTVAEKEKEEIIPQIINTIKTGGDYMHTHKAMVILAVLIVLAIALFIYIRKNSNKSKH